MINSILAKVNNLDILKGVFSTPLNSPYEKISFEKVNELYHVSKYQDNKVFHDNLSSLTLVLEAYASLYANLNLFDETYVHSFRITKKGKMLYNKSKHNQCITCKQSQNKEKEYLIKPGTIVPPLVDMGIFTKDGQVVKSMYDKFKQINRFLEVVDDTISKANLTSLKLIDFGCGKSYLTFILYYYFKYLKNIDIEIIGLDLKKDVIIKCNEASKKYGYDKLRFELGDINGFKAPFKVDMVVTLHACNMATDYALFNAISWDAKYIFSVPCCQHEVNEQFASKNFNILNRYGLAKERISSLYTDVIRCNMLAYQSYKVDMLEFIDMSHTPKNILIRASKVNSTKDRLKYLKEVEDLQAEFGFSQCLYRLLTKN